MNFKRIAFFVLTVLVIGCSFTWLRFTEKKHLALSSEAALQKWSHAKADIPNLRTGDLIFRHGRGFISNALMSLNQHEKKYSHAGIISVENDKVFVYHAIGGEENKSNKLRKELLEVFCNPCDIHSFGIYRRALANQEKIQIDSLADHYYKSALEFDTDFDLRTDDKMYCTEFVYKIFNIVLRNDNYLTSSTFSGMKYIACDDLYLNPHCILLYSYQY